MIRSALAMVRAIEGAGRNVWEFTPSGTMPVTCARFPATFSTMLVIGATVVTTRGEAAERWVGSASINPSSRARVTLPPAEWRLNLIAMVVWAPYLLEMSGPPGIQPLSLWERVAEGRVRAPQ